MIALPDVGYMRSILAIALKIRTHWESAKTGTAIGYSGFQTLI
ncbi:hypothetical protein Oscil6304_1882 [Oscillatoria acuminata PCC 6304]|uniref:Uncharacterized protein n=1 Tax=Oscillatoria acuminata PCC 6304 TaxID=56110 RepID=K9TGM2_9CYAN|nr:hypothetical protein Oscil6304_1882 [Oscillatoria acuminata PCC 6304]